MRPRSISDRYGTETPAVRATSRRVRPCRNRTRRSTEPISRRSSGVGVPPVGAPPTVAARRAAGGRATGGGAGLAAADETVCSGPILMPPL